MAAAAPKSPACDEERVHDAQEWVYEAKAVIKVNCVLMRRIGVFSKLLTLLRENLTALNCLNTDRFNLLFY